MRIPSHARMLDAEWEQELPGGRYIIPGFTESESKALWMVNEFEVGGGSQLVFWGLSADFDGMGISFGIAQWNIGAGSLQPLLREFDRTHPEKFARIFADGTDGMRRMLALNENVGAQREQQLAFIRTFVTKKVIREPWKTRLEALGQDPDFQDQMLRKLRGLMDSAIRAAQALGLRSERALALCFDIHIWPGPYWFKLPKEAPVVQHGLPQLFAKEERRRGAPLSERDKLLLLADLAAARASSTWKLKATQRKRVIVQPGTFRERHRDLEVDYGLGDAPFTHNLGGKIPSGAALSLPRGRRVPAPSPALSPAPKGAGGALPGLFATVSESLSRAREATLVTSNMAQGVRDLNHLTNLVFWLRHPDRKDTRIQSHEKDLAAEWLSIRDTVVRPLLDKPAAPATPAPPGTPPARWPDAPVAPPRAGAGDKIPRNPPPAGSTVSPLARMAWKLRGTTKTRGRKINSVVVHTTGRGWQQGYTRDKGTRPPVWYQLRVYLDQQGGYPHYVIDYDGGIFVTADEDNEAWHAGWSNLPTPASAYWQTWSAPWWWQQAWSAHGKRTPMDLLPPGARTPNTTSIGIELLPTEDAQYTDAQLRSLAKLIADIERRHHFQVPSAPSPQLLGHEDLNPLPMARQGRAYDDDRGGWDPGAHQKKPMFSWPRLWGYLLKARQGAL
ncbi:N-acetylmuramoyl-L-alanine amidase [Pyxidicoccus parkwayensis]|uniref:N-acetylmuramoyl-L-alanine amidase n=1 Tax=Pyxidicoccus parkwayensis TaxID=2813578 RepID=A0ABX7P684_9BACT|nr:peptidoglycan recognition family protein [Pyxidicoccus parkwaysis]QSQ25951.1 N-acetylmuramoyl-L-alanine amidase [Pyxidicoccus parkwaysis]